MPHQSNHAGSPATLMRNVLRRAVDLLTTPPVLTIFTVINALVVAVAAWTYLAETTTPVGTTGTRIVTGDYLAFLTSAELIARGDSASLYDLDAQKRLQRELAGIELDGWQPYPYPPLLGIALTPLTTLPFEWGFRAFAALSMLSATLGAVALARSMPMTRSSGLATLTLVTLTLGFYPLASILPGRQTTAVTLALLCGALWACQSGRAVLAGILVGLLSYKPQFMIPVLALLAWRGQWISVAASVATGLGHYLVGAALIGPDWPLRFLDAAAQHSTLEMAQNSTRHFSLLPFARSIFGGPAAQIFGAALMLSVLVTYLWRAPRVAPSDPRFALLWALTVLTGMLISPYLQYYEFGLLVLPCAVAIDAMIARAGTISMTTRILLGGVYLGYPLLVSSDAESHSQTPAVLMMSMFVWLCWEAKKGSDGAAGR